MMSKDVIAFTVLLVILVVGIFIMVKPHFFVLQMQATKGIIILASIFIIVGIVGLCVLGFRIFKELGLNDTQKNI
jgi:hypothetical protein